MGLYRTQALVLGYRPLGEADKILTLFSPDRGKIHAVARGVRRPRSRLLGGTQLFTHSNFLIFEGRSLDNISQCEIIESFHALRANLELIAYSLYFTELLRVSTPLEDKNRDLFCFLLKTQQVLSSWSDPEILKYIYETKLMALQGFSPELFCCVNCGNEIVGPLKFSPLMGGVVCGRCNSVSGITIHPEVLKTLRRFLRCTYEQLQSLKVDFDQKKVLKRVLQAFIEHRVERKIKTLGFLHDVSSLGLCKRGVKEV